MDAPDTKLSLAELQKQNAALSAENSYLKQELSALLRLIFGQKRERFLPADADTQVGLSLSNTALESGRFSILLFVFLFCCSTYSQTGHSHSAQLPTDTGRYKNSTSKADLPAYKDASLSNEERTKDLLSRMTLEEKTDLLAGENLNTKENKRLGIPKILMTDGPLGPNVRKQSTNYSAMINLAASFDTDLMRRVAENIGEETRIMGRNMLLAPMINIIRLPHWGRSFEVFSEDPYLSSRMTAAYVKGVQSKNVIACTKVMAANNQEWNRLSVDARIDERSLREIYLPSLEAAVKEAGTRAVMTAYNKVNGDYCAESKYLLTDLLKNEWGFDGFVVSDWNGTHSTVKMANAGLDLEMPTAKFYGEKLLMAVKQGEVNESMIDDKVRRILNAMFATGLFDESPDSNGGNSNTPQRNMLARETAQKSIVLLKNENNFLPLNKNDLKSIAVIGPNGNVAQISGGGSGNLEGNYAVSPFEGLVNLAGETIKVVFERGVPIKKSNLPVIAPEFYILESGEPGIKAEYYNNMKQEGDPVLTRIEKNIDFDWNPSGHADSDHYGSPRPDVINTNQWSARWTGLLKSPGEGVFEIGFLSNNGIRLYLDGKKILDNWIDAYPGQLKMTNYHFEADRTYRIRVDFYEETGTSHCKLGIAAYVPDVTTIQKALMIAAEADVVVLCLGLNKLLEFDKKNIDPLFPFGFGLSYTRFDLKNLELSRDSLTENDTLTVSVSIKNIGERDGDEVVQLYIQDVKASVEREVKSLKGFRRVSLRAGEERTVDFKLTKDHLSFYDVPNKRWTAEPGRFKVLIGNSSRDIHLEGEFDYIHTE